MHWVVGIDILGGANKVQVSGDFAYMVSGGSGDDFQVIDITDHENPQIIGSVDTPGLAVDVCVNGPIALIADKGGDLQIIGISNPEHPQILGSVSTPGYALGVSFFGTHAYVAVSKGVENNNDTMQLQVIDVSNLILPEIMDTKIRTLIISVQGGAHHGQEEKSIHPGVQA